MSNAAEVRAWALAQGIEVGTRGRLSADLFAAFDAANGGKPAKVAKPVQIGNVAVPVAEVREWATEAGLTVPAKGRPSKSVVKAFVKAHPQTLRQIALDAGLTVPKRGRLSADLVAEVLATL